MYLLTNLSQLYGRLPNTEATSTRELLIQYENILLMCFFIIFENFRDLQFHNGLTDNQPEF